MDDPRGGDRPDYKVYRSRRGRLGSGRSDDALAGLRDRPRGRDDGRPRPSGAPGRWTAGRVLKWVVAAIVAWLVLSFVLFMVSAQVEQGVSGEAKSALSGGSNFFTGSTVLVLGSDQRKGASIDKTSSGPGRADSIMLVRASFGGIRKLSIPRDSAAAIAGAGVQKINAAYAIGGPSLMIRTVESYLGNGLKINHLIEVDFRDFPAFIDSLGGITVQNKTRICSPQFDNFYKGFDLPAGKVKLDGRKALGFARVRKNPCAPAENDLDRAARQQEVLGGIRSQLLSPFTFLRLPLVSWRAPKTIRSDLRGPGLLALAADVATGGSGQTRVLKPSCLGCGPAGSLLVPEGERAAEVKTLLGR